MQRKFSIVPFAVWSIGISFLISCSKDKIPPIAIASVFPSVADTTIVIEFSGAASRDNTTFLEGLFFSWDFDGDGEWDVYREQDIVFTHTYSHSGKYMARMQAEDHRGLVAEDSVEVLIKASNHLVGTLTDPRDGQRYKTVFLRNRWWMAENLNYGKWISSLQEQTNNEEVEKYFFMDDSSQWGPSGGIYKWEEAIAYSTRSQGICPPGWSIPSQDDWQGLLTDIDPWYAWQYYGKNGLSKFNIHSGFAARRENNSVLWYKNQVDHWSREYFTAPFLREQAPYVFYYKADWGKISIQYRTVLYDESDGMYLIASVYGSVRCIQDE